MCVYRFVSAKEWLYHSQFFFGDEKSSEREKNTYQEIHIRAHNTHTYKYICMEFFSVLLHLFQFDPQ